MESNTQRTMSTTEIDLESVLQVRRRRLSVTTPHLPNETHRYTDVIFLKVEKLNDLLKEDSRCIFHGTTKWSHDNHFSELIVFFFLFFQGDYHVLSDIFQKYTSHIIIHHDDPDLVRSHDRLSGKIYTTIELPTMSLIEVLEILHKHFFSIVANSTNFGQTHKQQEFILLRNKDCNDAGRPLPTIDTKSH